MKDTRPAVERKFHQMLLKRSGAERLKMGCSMHATARALAKAHLSQEHPGSDPAELRRLLFLHFYRADFSRAQRNRIASALSESGRRSKATEARVRGAFEPEKSESLIQVAERPASDKAKRPANKRK